MAVSLTIDGVSRSYPSGTDEEWGSDATIAMQQVCTSALWKGTLTTKGDIYVATADATVTRLGVGSNDQIIIADSAETPGVKWGANAPEGTAIKSTDEAGGTKFLREDGDGTCSWQAVSGSKPELSIDYPAGTFYYPASNPAPLNTDAGSNNTIKAHLFDASTDESVTGQFQVPSDVDTSGTVTFEAYGYSGAASPDGTVEMAISQVPKNNDEVWDAAYTTTENADAVTFDIQDELKLMSWTETVSNLGWAASDLVNFKLFRDVSEDTLSTDYSLVHFRIRIPRT